LTTIVIALSIFVEHYPSIRTDMRRQLLLPQPVLFECLLCRDQHEAKFLYMGQISNFMPSLLHNYMLVKIHKHPCSRWDWNSRPWRFCPNGADHTTILVGMHLSILQDDKAKMQDSYYGRRVSVSSSPLYLEVLYYTSR